jgi:hypothetical protein
MPGPDAAPNPLPPNPFTHAVSIVTEDKSKEPEWIRTGRRGLLGAHWAFTAGLVLILGAALLITAFDAYVGLNSGLPLLDITLEAQANAVLAIVAVIGGSYAALRILTPAAKEAS